MRSLVQQDMLRPKSAMFYIDSLEEISQEFVAKMSAKSDSEMEVDDVLSYIHRWALESVVKIFLNTRLGCLEENLAPDSDTARIIATTQQVMGPDSFKMMSGVPVWKYVPTPYYKRFDEASTELYHLSKKMIDAAAERFRTSGNLIQSI